MTMDTTTTTHDLIERAAALYLVVLRHRSPSTARAVLLEAARGAVRDMRTVRPSAESVLDHVHAIIEHERRALIRAHADAIVREERARGSVVYHSSVHSQAVARAARAAPELFA